MCVCSVKRPVKACAKGGYSKKPPPSNPPEPAFHPSICVWGLVGFVFSTYLSNTSHSQSWNVPKDGSLMLLSSNNMVSYGYKYSHLGTSNCSHSLFVFLMRNVSGETGDSTEQNSTGSKFMLFEIKTQLLFFMLGNLEGKKNHSLFDGQLKITWLKLINHIMQS